MKARIIKWSTWPIIDSLTYEMKVNNIFRFSFSFHLVQFSSQSFSSESLLLNEILGYGNDIDTGN